MVDANCTGCNGKGYTLGAGVATPCTVCPADERLPLPWPCPFCGTVPVVEVNDNGADIWCRECEAYVYAHGRNPWTVLGMWNRRPE